MKQMEKIANPRKKLQDTLMSKCVELRLEFSNLRITHPVLIFVIVWVRFLSGTFFNLAVVGSQPAYVFRAIRNLWSVVTQLGMKPQREYINLILLLFITIFYGFALVSFGSQNAKRRRTAFMIAVAVFVVSPIVARYVVYLVTRPNYLPLSHPLLVVGVICLAIGFILQFVFFTLALSSKMKNENLLACQKNFLILIKLQLNNLITIISTILLHHLELESFCIFVTSIHLLASLGPIYSISRQYIFHSEYSQSVYTTISCCEFSFSLMAFICQLSKDKLFVGNIELLTFILSLFLYYAIKQYKGFRDNRIMIHELTEARSLKIYLHIISCSLMKKDQSSQIDFIFNVLRDRHKKNCHLSQCLCQIKQSKREDLDELNMFLISKAIKQIMTDFHHDFQLNILCSFFLLDFLNTFPDLLTNLNKIKDPQVGISAELEYEYFKTCLRNFLDHKKMQVHAMETQKIQQQDELIMFSVVMMKQILQCKYEFWINLSKKTPNLIVLNNLVEKQTSLTEKIQEIFPQIFKDFLYSRILLELISIYDFCIKLKDSPRAQLKQALRYEYVAKTEAAKISKGQNFKMEALLFNKNCVIFESQIQRNRMGIISNVTKNIEEVFGFKRQAIIGQNINEFMPRSMQKQHDIILESWRERASWTNIHKIRHIFAMNKDSLCFSTSIYLRIMQRQDSVNLLATFLKGNENDYLLINEDGIIDGVGLNFRKILGSQIAKIPFSSICDNSETLFSDARNTNQKKKIVLTCYHTKGLEDKLELYQLSKFQISKSISQSDFLPETQIKTSHRCIEILVFYEPYRMGNRFFIILKFVSVQKTKSSKQIESELYKKNDINVSYAYHESNLQSNTYPPDSQKKVCQYNSSIHTSNFGLSSSTETLFNNLHQKMNKNHVFANRSISLYLGVVFFCAFTTIVILLAEHVIELYLNDNFDDHSKESLRFFKKYTSVSLTHSRILNIQRNQTDVEFQIQRAIVELKRVQNSMDNQHIDLWLDDQWGHPGTLEKIMDLKQKSQATTIVFEEYYNFYLAYCKRLYEMYIQKQGRLFQQFQYELIQQNQGNFKKYIDDSLQILENSIIQDLEKAIILSRSVIALYTFFVFVIGYLIQKFQKTEEKHCEEVFNVYFSISDKNCDICTNYYRKAISIFKQCMTSTAHTGNQAKKMELEIVEKNPLLLLRKKLDVEFDKFSRKKTSNVSLGSKRLKIKIAGLGLLLLLGVIIRQIQYEDAHLKQTDYVRTYFSIFKAENQLVSEFITVKQIIYNPNSTTNSQLVENLKNSLKKNQRQGFASIFFRLLNVTNRFNNYGSKIISLSESQSLCVKMLEIDPEYYQHICHSEDFPYAKLKLFQANSIILQNMQNAINYFSSNSNINDLFKVKLKITENVLNLKYIYLCNFFLNFESVTDSYHHDKINLLVSVTAGIIIFLLVVLVLIVYFAKHISKTMMIPEIVLKSTKGAMRHIDTVLQAVE